MKADVISRVMPRKPANIAKSPTGISGISRVAMSWSESGGPKVVQSNASGFGTTLIQRVITYDLDGQADVSFAPGGVLCQLAFPLKPDAVSIGLPGSAMQPD